MYLCYTFMQDFTIFLLGRYSYGESSVGISRWKQIWISKPLVEIGVNSELKL